MLVMISITSILKEMGLEICEIGKECREEGGDQRRRDRVVGVKGDGDIEGEWKEYERNRGLVRGEKVRRG